MFVTSMTPEFSSSWVRKSGAPGRNRARSDSNICTAVFDTGSIFQVFAM